MISTSLLTEFKNLLGKENVMDSESDRHAYSYDAAVLDAVIPELVLRPTNSEQLGKTVALCNENKLPMTVRGAGTNLSGGTIPTKEHGVVILTNGLNKILEINEQDLYAVVQPGVVTAKFAAEVARRGLFYPPDPGSQAVSTLGGNVSENAGGLRGLKYGVTSEITQIRLVIFGDHMRDDAVLDAVFDVRAAFVPFVGDNGNGFEC